MAYWFQWFFGRLIELLGRIFFDLRFEGLEHLEECELPVIFVSNHKSWIDHFIIIAGALRRKWMVPIHVLVSDKIYARPIVGTICKLLGAYPALYGSGIEISLAPLIKRLEEGACVGLYPEGGMEKGYNKFREPKPGAAWLALQSGRHILPMAIKGLEDFSWGSLFLGNRFVTIKLGTPFKLEGKIGDSFVIERNSRVVMRQIITLYNSIPPKVFLYVTQR